MVSYTTIITYTAETLQTIASQALSLLPQYTAEEFQELAIPTADNAEWTSPTALLAALRVQEFIDPLTVFGPVKEFCLEELYGWDLPMLGGARRESGWGAFCGDSLTLEERGWDWEERVKLACWGMLEIGGVEMVVEGTVGEESDEEMDWFGRVTGCTESEVGELEMEGAVEGEGESGEEPSGPQGQKRKLSTGEESGEDASGVKVKKRKWSTGELVAALFEEVQRMRVE